MRRGRTNGRDTVRFGLKAGLERVAKMLEDRNERIAKLEGLLVSLNETCSKVIDERAESLRSRERIFRARARRVPLGIAIRNVSRGRTGIYETTNEGNASSD